MSRIENTTDEVFEQLLSDILSEEIAREFILQKDPEIDETLFKQAVAQVRKASLSGTQSCDICVMYFILKQATNLNNEPPAVLGGV